MEQFKKTLIDALLAGGNVLKKHFGKLRSIERKGKIDLVTVADLESEKAIIETIKSCFPDHAFFAEETGKQRTDSDYRWVIDPLDGTTNYAHSIPLFCISIALEKNKDLLLGGIYQPLTDDFWYAEKGKGAFKNDEPIHVSEVDTLIDSVFVTGFPYTKMEQIDHFMEVFKQVMLRVQGVRRLGSAAIDYCAVAEGQFEAFWEELLGPWDMAAGTLLVREAGGGVTDFSGAPFKITGTQMLATNGLVHEETLSVLSQFHGKI